MKSQPICRSEKNRVDDLGATVPPTVKKTAINGAVCLLVKIAMLHTKNRNNCPCSFQEKVKKVKLLTNDTPWMKTDVDQLQ